MLHAIKKMFSHSLPQDNAYNLSEEQKEFWQKNGYLVLKKYFDNNQIGKINSVVDELWKRRKSLKTNIEIDVLSGPLTGTSMPFGQADDDIRDNVYKLNNLFILHKEIRDVVLDAHLKDNIGTLLEGEPIICNSLNFERGSQQPYHIDTWYMPPPVEGRLVASFIALEDIGPDQGPFTYYPGSHLIPPYYFSHGRLNVIPEEIKKCREYLHHEIETRGLRAETFPCEKGDVFLWHAQLYHGGSPINDLSLTRKSLVTHYWRKQDVAANQLMSDKAGSYLARTLRGELEA